METASTEFRLIHMSVDGSLANPHVKIAVIIWALCIAVITAAAIARLHRRRRSGIWLLLVAAALSSLTPWAQLRIAWLVQTAAAGEPIPTTFFGPPPGWLAPSAGIAVGLLAGVVIVTRERWNRMPFCPD